MTRLTDQTDTEKDEITVCPYCDSPKIKARVSTDTSHRVKGSPPSDEKDYRCMECPKTFDEPDTRKRYSHDTHTPRSILKRLGVSEEHLPPQPDLSHSDDSVEPNGDSDNGTEPDDVEDSETVSEESKTDGSEETDRPSLEELDRRRVEHGLSQSELSRRAGFERNRFNHILSKELNPTDETLDALIEVLEQTDPLDEDDLSSKRGPKPQPSSVLTNDTERDHDARAERTHTKERST